MRTLSCWLAGTALLAAIGCSGGGSNPTAPPTTGSAVPVGSVPTGTGTGPISVSGSLGTAVQTGDIHTSALAIYTVDINTETLSATSHLKETRSGQANDDLYLLSIDSFLNAGSFKITNVSADVDSVDLGYVVSHPFPAPSNPTGTPNGSTNRADLGISGMVLFLADVASATGNTYFTDRVANTALVDNADAYYSPGGLLTTTGTANTFPYRQLVDEVADSRVGVSNGGNVDGNFGADGWTLSELGVGNAGWTGGGVLHGGQSSASSVSLDKGELSGGFSLDVAIIAKYGDPRGGTTGAQKKANRLPPAAADATKFAYRLPHNALDGARIVVESDPAGFIANTISAATISVHVVDPDARATETVAADLSADLGFQTVAVGESGTPTVEVCIPGVNGTATTVADLSTVVDDDSTYGGDLAADTGVADDALFFQDSITKAAGAGETAGDFTGMVRVTDPEIGLVIGLDGALAPLPTAPAPITYQAFTVTQLPDNAPPSAIVTLLSPNPLNSGTPASVGITSIADLDADNLNISVDWGNGGGFVTVAAAHPSPYTNLSPSSPNMNNLDLVVDAITVTVRLDDGIAQVDYPVNYDLGANRPPQVTATPALAAVGVYTPAIFTMNAGTATATDPEGDTITRTITNNRNADVVTFANFPNAANTTAITNPPNATVAFTVYANDALHPTTGGTVYPVVNGNINTIVLGGWVYTPLASTSSAEVARAIEVDGSGNVYIAGTRASGAAALNFGGGVRPLWSTSNEGFLLKLDSSGNYVWDREWGCNSSFMRAVSLDYDNAGNLYVGGGFSNVLTIAHLGGGATNQTGGGTTSSEDYYVLKFDNAGTYAGIGRTNDTIDELATGASVGFGTSAANYGPGPTSLRVNRATSEVFLTGGVSTTAASLMDWGSGVTMTMGGSRDAFLVKFNSSMTPQWVRDLAVAPSANTHYGITCALDGSGNPYVGGSFATSMDFGAGVVNVIGGQDGFIVARNAGTGAFIPGSVRIIASNSTGSEQVSCLRIVGSTLYASGVWGGAAAQTMTLGAPLTNMTASGSGQGFVGAYAIGGAPIWQRPLIGSSYNLASNLAVSATDVYVVGQYSNVTSDWGYGVLPIVTASDFALTKFNAATGGLTGYSRTWGTTATAEYATCLALTAAGDPITAGQYGITATTLDFDPGAGVANRTSAGGADIYAVKLVGTTGTF